MVTLERDERAICPECRDGKCGNCIGYALNADDVVVACACLTRPLVT